MEVDIEGPHPVEPGDCFLLCSDGLSNMVRGDEMGAVVGALPPDEAARFLIELANLRGGPDNITVSIVQTSGTPAPEAAAKAGRKGPTPLGRLLHAWNRRVPWPFSILGIGSLLAVLALAMHLGEVRGAIPLFVLATLVIVAGLAGLVLFFRNGPRDADGIDDSAPRKLNVYKTYTNDADATILDGLTQLENSLAETMKAQEIPADWDAYQRLAHAAAQEAKKGAVPAAIRARCKALGTLAQSFNKSRHKEESFRPSWTAK